MIESKDLKLDRDAWVRTLRSHGVQWSDETFEAIRHGGLIAGMRYDPVRFLWGNRRRSFPQGDLTVWIFGPANEDPFDFRATGAVLFRSGRLLRVLEP
ncbi:MAG TPA: hypothetical protein VI643_02260 [Planctomycetota bacterium]|nr:hypothetical protein [Planctomycetota bacterium]